MRQADGIPFFVLLTLLFKRLCQGAFVACGSMVLSILSVFRFCALRAQKRNTKEDEVPLQTIACSHSKRAEVPLRNATH
jgi:hypothetical protein